MSNPPPIASNDEPVGTTTTFLVKPSGTTTPPTPIPSASIPSPSAVLDPHTNINLVNDDTLLPVFPVAPNTSDPASSASITGAKDTSTGGTPTRAEPITQSRTLVTPTNTLIGNNPRNSNSVAVVAGSLSGGIVLLAIFLTILLIKRRERLRRHDTDSDGGSSIPTTSSVAHARVVTGLPLRTVSAQDGNANHNRNTNNKPDNHHRFPPSSQRQLHRQQGQHHHSRSDSGSHRPSSTRIRSTGISDSGRTRGSGGINRNDHGDEENGPRGPPVPGIVVTGDDGRSGRSIPPSHSTRSNAHTVRTSRSRLSEGRRTTNVPSGDAVVVPMGMGGDIGSTPHPNRDFVDVGSRHRNGNITTSIPSVSIPATSSMPQTIPILMPTPTMTHSRERLSISSSIISDVKSPSLHNTNHTYTTTISPSPPPSSPPPTLHHHSTSITTLSGDANGTLARGSRPSSPPTRGSSRSRESEHRVRVSSPPPSRAVHTASPSQVSSLASFGTQGRGHSRSESGSLSHSSEQTVGELQLQIEALRRENEALRHGGTGGIMSPGRVRPRIPLSMPMPIPHDAPPAYDAGPGPEPGPS